MWTREALHELINGRLKGLKFIVVSNREPYIHLKNDGGITCIQPASGLATALDPIMRASGGTWIAHGSGSGDRAVVDERNHIEVPPDSPAYTLRRVWLDRCLEQRYYYGLSNEGLWPLCHAAFHRPTFRLKDWTAYRMANQVFADAVLEEAAGGPAFVFIQDYHFGLLPRILKDRNPQLFIAQFWHIPWPNRETFRAFPWREELLDGMLGNDVLGFHLRYHCANFVESVDRGIEAMVDMEYCNVTRGGHTTMVRPFPISIDFESHSETACSEPVDHEIGRWLDRLRGSAEFVGVGIDRLDYTKGIPDRLEALDLFFENNPTYRGRLVFIQVGVPSREEIPSYRRLVEEIEDQIQWLNSKWGTSGWQPVLFVKRHVAQTELMALHRLADFCLVTSLHDGMNLVAKEYVASRFDEDGVLILSSFTGASLELTDALLVNPFSPDEIAHAIGAALNMPREDRRRRMMRLREAVSENNVYRWAGKIVSTLLKFEFAESGETAEVAYQSA